MDSVRAAAILFCLTLSVVTMGTGSSAPISAQPTNMTTNSSNTEELGSGGAELNRTLHEEITHALDELEDETNLLNRVRRIVTKRSGGSYTCSMSCIPKTFEELKVQLNTARKNEAKTLVNGGLATIRVWSVKVNLENGYSISTSFGAAPGVLDIMQSAESHNDCIDVSFDENKHRFPTYLLRAELKDSCTQKSRYTCNTADNVLTLRLSQSACQSDGKESWSPLKITWRNCKLSSNSQ